MAIKAKCGSCGRIVKAKDALAGKRVKCPDCSQPMTIPNPAQTTSAGYQDAAKMLAPTGGAYNPILDLLDDAGVQGVARGPACDNCGEEIAAGSVICVKCGFNMSTGEMLETTVYDDDDKSGMTDAEKILRQAEEDIEETPIDSASQNFGDGNDSMLIAVISFVVFAVFLGIAVAFALSMDKVAASVEGGSATISLYASIFVVIGCATWITIVAFLANKTHGVICVCTLGLYCMIFGFMQKGLMLPTIIMIGASVIGLACYAYLNAGESAMLLEPAVQHLACLMR